MKNIKVLIAGFLLGISAVVFLIIFFFPRTNDNPDSKQAGYMQNPNVFNQTTNNDNIKTVEKTDLIKEINNIRAVNGLSRLSNSSKLESAGELRLKDMEEVGYLKFGDPNEKHVSEILKSLNYTDYNQVQENVYFNRENAKLIAEGLAKDPNGELLNENFTHVGIYMREIRVNYKNYQAIAIFLSEEL